MKHELMQEAQDVRTRITGRLPAFHDFNFHDASPPDSRECGDCSLCCKLPEIDDPDAPDITKPAGKWCKYCPSGQGGCGIYEDRPQLCKTFLCGWRAFPIGDHWYPRACGMVIHSGKDIIYVHVDAGAKSRWREEPWFSDLHQLAEQMHERSGMFVHVIPQGYNGSWLIDQTGRSLPPLKVPPGYTIIYMLMLPPLLIRVEDVDAWKTDEPWIGETYVHFANTVTNISDKAERIAVARRGRSRALGSFYQRAKERGWIVDSERRSIVKAG